MEHALKVSPLPELKTPTEAELNFISFIRTTGPEYLAECLEKVHDGALYQSDSLDRPEIECLYGVNELRKALVQLTEG